ncbi:MAG: hypothetical protein ACI9N9_001440 [Enterobacterales bacterium]|jgi:hypothetical protein
MIFILESGNLFHNLVKHLNVEQIDEYLFIFSVSFQVIEN